MRLRIANPPEKFELLRFAERSVDVVDRVVNGSAVRSFKQRSGMQPIERIPALSHADAEAKADPEEWRTNRATCRGYKEFSAGDIEELHWDVVDRHETVPWSKKPVPRYRTEKNGYLKVYLSNTYAHHLKLKPEDYTGTPPRITVSSELLAAYDQSKFPFVVSSIVDGELS